MDSQSLMPQAVQPIHRIAAGQLPAALAELSEEALSSVGRANGVGVLSSSAEQLGEDESVVEYLLQTCHCWFCSYDGDDAE